MPGPGGEGGDHDLVEREGEGQQGAGQQRRAGQREGDVAERLEQVGAQVGRGLVDVGGQASQAGDHVVEHDHDAEGGVGHDEGDERRAGSPACWNPALSATPVTMPGSAIGQHEQQRHGVAPEEAEALHGQRGQAAEHQGDPRGRDRHLQRVIKRLARVRVRGRPACHHLQAEAGRRPDEGPGRAEREHEDHDQRDVEEGEHEARWRAAVRSGPRRDTSIRGSPARRSAGCASSSTAMMTTGTQANAAACGRLPAPKSW